MQKNNAVRSDPGHSHPDCWQQKPKRTQRRTQISARHSATPHLILAPGPSLCVPSLAEIPYDYFLNSDPAFSDSIIEIAAQCVDSGIGSPELWAEAGKKPAMFLELALQAHAHAQQIDFIETAISLELHLWKIFSDNADEFMLSLGVSGCAALVVGTQVERLEAMFPGLAAAWYKTLYGALSVGGLLFDYIDSVQHYENLMNASGEDPQEAGANNELTVFNPDRFVPDCLKTVVKSPEHGPSSDDVLMLQKHCNGQASRAIRPVLEMWRISQKPECVHWRGALNIQDEITQLPYCVLAFSPNDSIYAAFDEFGQYAYESDCSGTLIEQPLSVKRPQDFTLAIQALDSYLEFLRHLATLRSVLEEQASQTTPA